MTKAIKDRKAVRKRERDALAQRGFTVVELLLAVLIILIMAAVAIPGYQQTVRYLRLSGDMRDLNGVVAQAKMRSAASFTRARAYADLAGNTFHLETWDKTNSCWHTEGDTQNTCTASSSPAIPLSQGVTFGFGSVGTGSPNPQTPIQQAAACKNGSGSDLANTACIVFNSRGIPIDPATNAPLSGARDAFYITDTRSVWGLTVRAPGAIQIWSSPATSTNWMRR